MIFIGIDPGASGGVGIVTEDNAEAFVWNDEYFIETMREISIGGTQSVAVVEKVGAMPKQGVTSMFNFGKSAGFIEGVLQAFRIPYQLLPPNVWKREFSLMKKDKKDSVKTCKCLFPTVNLLRTERCKKEHDGMAEALLMAEYARRKMGR